VPAKACALTVSSQTWDYATRNSAAIADHWRQQKKENPAFFNGPVWLASQWSFSDDTVFHATFIRAEFKAYLYWRWRGFEAAGVWDTFGSGVVRAREGALLLGEQSPGNVNVGKSYPPAGFIDDSDIGVAGTAVDIAASITREIKEETGLVCADMQRRRGYWITLCGAQISIAMVFDSPLSGAELSRRVRQSLAQQNQPELARIHMVHSSADMSRLSIPAYGQILLPAVLDLPLRQD